MTRRSLLALIAAAPAAMQARFLPVDERGYRRAIADLKGRVVLADFWATWCVPCREEMPRLVALSQKFRGVKLLTISCDEPEQEKGALDFLGRNRAPGPFYLKRAADDDKFINSVDPKWSGALPALFLYDRQGQQAKSFVGETDMNALEGALRKLL